MYLHIREKWEGGNACRKMQWEEGREYNPDFLLATTSMYVYICIDT